MRRAIQLILLLLFSVLTVLPASAEEVLVLLSLRSKGYREAVAAARQTCRVSYREVSIGETQDLDLPRLARESRAKVVLAVGDSALRLAASALPRLPMVGLLTLESSTVGDRKTVSYQANPDQYLQVLKQLGRRRVAVIYGARMASYARKAEAAAARYGIGLVRREVKGGEELGEVLSSIKGQADALWVLPDSAVVTPGTVDKLFEFTSEAKIPAIVFAKNYLNSGAAVALEPERAILGRQAGELVCDALGHEHENSSSGSPGKAFSLHGNQTILQRLGLQLP